MNVKKKKTRNVLAFTWTFVKKYKFAFWMLLITSLLAALDETVTPLMFDVVLKNVENFVENLSTYEQMRNSLYQMILAWVGFDLVYRVSCLFAAYLYPLIEADVRMYMFNEVQHYKPGYFNNEAAEGAVENGVADTADGVHEVVEFLLTTLLPTAASIFASIILIFKRNGFTGFLIFTWSCFHIFMNIFLLKRAMPASSNFQAAQNNLAGKVIDSLLNRNVTLQNNNQKGEYEYVLKYQEKEVKAHRNLLLTNEKTKYILNIAIIFVSILLFHNILKLLATKAIVMSDLVYLYTSTFNIVRSVWLIGTQLGPFIEALGQCEKGFSILDDSHKIYDNQSPEEFVPKNYSIEFRNVTLYEGDKCLLDNVSFFIESGEKVAILGKSGSGKTTILRTLIGITSPYSGDIFIGGMNLKSVNMNEVRDIISVLDQKSYIFNRTILENIILTNKNANMHQIKQVTEKAEFYEFVKNQQDEFNTEVHPNKLSGGQCQKLALARFFLKNGKILLFDEMSTGLDIFAQKQIATYIGSLRNMTCLFVDHNLTYRDIFDKIIIIDQGKIIGKGTPEELLKTSEMYNKIINLFKEGSFKGQKEV